MNSEMQMPVATPEPVSYSVPWKPIDNWIGVLILGLMDVGLLVIALQGERGQMAQSGLLAIVQLAFLLPVVVIFAWRRIHWKHLGFGGFSASTMGVGCGLLVASYGIILLHNLLLVNLGIDTQGEAIAELFAALESPIWFFIVGALLAPLIEEIFFRGFLFQGFRARYGWVSGMLLSSGIFAVAHLDPVSLIPTFILGCVLAYLYHRSNSVWPGVILHVMVNSFGLCAAYVATQYPQLIPS
ncbi:MAG TPA: type II CAAX endopeptidase family protein [Anaerolineales bacterium]|nr:type II CAAX endopeptidase family protein [Anaerolineales bacterium]